MPPVTVAPDRHSLQCGMWDCNRITPGFFCTLGHGFRAKSEEETHQAVVYVDLLSFNKEGSLSLKILNTKSQGLRCGVPTLATQVLQDYPWAFPNIFHFNLMENETKRNLVFFSETVLPSNIWFRYNTTTVLGMERLSWNLRPQPALGRYRLRRYRLANYPNSLYWLHYDLTKGPEKTISETVPKFAPDNQKEGPPDPGAGGGPSYASTSGYMSAKGNTEPQLRGFMDVSHNHYVSLSLVILSRAFMVSGRAEDAVRATLSSIAWDTVDITSLPPVDSVSELRRKLGYLEMQAERIKEDEEDLTSNKGVRSSEEDKALKGMTILTANEAQEHARARVLEQLDDLFKLSCALALLASTSSGCRECGGELLSLVRKEMEFYNTMAERAAVKAYTVSDQAAEAYEISCALMEKVDGLMQNLESLRDRDQAA